MPPVLRPPPALGPLKRLRQARLSLLTPVEFEIIMTKNLALAAAPNLSPIPTAAPFIRARQDST